jgi:hypothetical protein
MGVGLRSPKQDQVEPTQLVLINLCVFHDARMAAKHRLPATDEVSQLKLNIPAPAKCGKRLRVGDEEGM